MLAIVDHQASFKLFRECPSDTIAVQLGSFVDLEALCYKLLFVIRGGPLIADKLAVKGGLCCHGRCCMTQIQPGMHHELPATDRGALQHAT